MSMGMLTSQWLDLGPAFWWSAICVGIVLIHVLGFIFGSTFKNNSIGWVFFSSLKLVKYNVALGLHAGTLVDQGLLYRSLHSEIWIFACSLPTFGHHLKSKACNFFMPPKNFFYWLLLVQFKFSYYVTMPVLRKKGRKKKREKYLRRG